MAESVGYRPNYIAQSLVKEQHQVDGLILFSTMKSCESVSILKEQNVPSVAILNEAGGLPCVSIDYRRAMYDAANYTISKEYKYLIFLCPPLAYEKIATYTPFNKGWTGSSRR